MTNPKPTTNEEIALELGWTYRKDRQDGWQTREWKAPNRSTHRSPPDFEHDWAHAGPLLEEMVVACEGGLPHLMHLLQVIFANMIESNWTLTQAISRAWLAWKKEEKDAQ